MRILFLLLPLLLASQASHATSSNPNACETKVERFQGLRKLIRLAKTLNRNISQHLARKQVNTPFQLLTYARDYAPSAEAFVRRLHGAKFFPKIDVTEALQTTDDFLALIAVIDKGVADYTERVFRRISDRTQILRADLYQYEIEHPDGSKTFIVFEFPQEGATQFRIVSSSLANLWTLSHFEIRDYTDGVTDVITSTPSKAELISWVAKFLTLAETTRFNDKLLYGPRQNIAHYFDKITSEQIKDLTHTEDVLETYSEVSDTSLQSSSYYATQFVPFVLRRLGDKTLRPEQKGKLTSLLYTCIRIVSEASTTFPSDNRYSEQLEETLVNLGLAFESLGQDIFTASFCELYSTTYASSIDKVVEEGILHIGLAFKIGPRQERESAVRMLIQTFFAVQDETLNMFRSERYTRGQNSMVATSLDRRGDAANVAKTRMAKYLLGREEIPDDLRSELKKYRRSMGGDN